MLFLLAEKMPEDPDEIGECLKGYVPPLVREHALDVIMQIINAKSQSSTSNGNDVRGIQISNQMEIIEPVEGKYYCLYILFKNRKFRTYNIFFFLLNEGMVFDVPGRKYRGSDFSAKGSLLFGNTLNNVCSIGFLINHEVFII